MKRRNVLMWFNITDLRLHDHYALTLAAKRCQQANEGGVVYPAFCFDTRTYATASRVAGFFQTHPRRARFVIDCVKDLKYNLRELHNGCPLWIRVGHPENEIARLARELDCEEVFCHEMFSPHEATVQQRTQRNLGQHGQVLRTVWGSTLIHIDDLPIPPSQMTHEFRRLVDIFESTRIRPTAPYDCRKKGSLPVPSGSEESYPAEIGSLPEIRELGYKDPLPAYDHQMDSRQVAMWVGGETRACEIVQTFLESDEGMRFVAPHNSKKPSGQFFGNTRATRISPWLAHGCISPRRFYELIRKYSLDQRGNHDWQCKYLIMRLVKRDFWHFMGKKFGKKLYRIEGPTPDYVAIEPPEVWRHDPLLIRRWCEGTTGTPFIDACARDLKTTGYITQEARQALLWYLVRGLQQDWRIAAEWFQRNAIDYDPHLNWGNAVFYSGLMFDIGTRAVDSSEKLALRYDTSGMYTRLWVPELFNVPTYFIHRVQAMTPRMQAMHSAVLGVDYPHPMKLWVGAENDPEVMKALKSYVDDSKMSVLGEGHTHGMGIPEPKVMLSA